MPDGNESDGLTPLCEGNPLARELARLVPAAPGFQRDALLFAAGAAARQAAVARWRIATVLAVALAVGAWGYVSLEPAAIAPPSRSNETVTSGRPSEPPAVATTPESTAPESAPLIVTFAEEADPGDRIRGLKLRKDILSAGLGVIPSTTRPEFVATGSLSDLEKALGLPAGTFAVPMREKPDQ
jgi:hypothetical protein